MLKEMSNVRTAYQCRQFSTEPLFTVKQWQTIKYVRKQILLKLPIWLNSANNTADVTKRYQLSTEKHQYIKCSFLHLCTPQSNLSDVHEYKLGFCRWYGMV